MKTIERLNQVGHEMSMHLFSLNNINPLADKKRATAYFQSGEKLEFDAPASHCFDAWGGYWSNFRLADYAAAMFPGCHMAGYNL